MRRKSIDGPSRFGPHAFMGALLKPDQLLRYYLPAYLLLFLFVAFVVPSWRTFRKTGKNPVMFGGGQSVHDLIGRYMKLVFLLLAIAVAVPAWFGSYYLDLQPLSYLEHDLLLISGLVLMHVALVWVVVAQVQMGVAWRIGIDREQGTLVQSGLFRVSRNPIFLGLALSLLGFFLIMPNSLTLLILALALVLISIQVRLEEEFLRGLHGQAYTDYCATVRRWL